MTKPKINCNSLTNQEIKRKFVDRHVLGNFTTEVLFILGSYDYQDAPFTYDDIENYHSGRYCVDCGIGYDNFTKEIDDDGHAFFICVDCGRWYTASEYVNHLTESYTEITEWYAVSEFLAVRLAEQGACIIEGPCVYYWGRQSAGQPVFLDSVISQICKGLEILDGQPRSWADTLAAR
jgi:hypothetical protein